MPGEQADILIVGAGIAGCAAALVLAERSKVVLIDRSATPAPRIGESLPSAALRLLERLNLRQQFEAGGHLPSLGAASLWGSGVVTLRDGFNDPLGHAWTLDRVAFDAMFRDAVRSRRVRLIAPAHMSLLVRTSPGGSGWRAELRSSDMNLSLDARFLISAYGRGPLPAVIATEAGPRVFDRLVCRFVKLPPQRASAVSGFSVVEAVEEGWWYQATLPDRHRILAYHTDADLPSARSSCDAEGFRALLRNTHSLDVSSLPASALPPDMPVFRTSARSQALATCCGAGWCAVGDAAVAFDPLSSQGIFNALYTGDRGAETALKALHGDATALPAYGEHIAHIVRTYRANLDHYYGLEMRFRENAFWERRRSSGKASALVPEINGRRLETHDETKQ
ncbi:MAG: FAD-dependent oxidoreductase [Candidatus Solibacter sp.]